MTRSLQEISPEIFEVMPDRKAEPSIFSDTRWRNFEKSPWLDGIVTGVILSELPPLNMRAKIPVPRRPYIHIQNRSRALTITLPRIAEPSFFIKLPRDFDWLFTMMAHSLQVYLSHYTLLRRKIQHYFINLSWKGV